MNFGSIDSPWRRNKNDLRASFPGVRDRLFSMVHQTGLEPARDSPCAPKAHAYTYFATGACVVLGADGFLSAGLCRLVRTLLGKGDERLSNFSTFADNFSETFGISTGKWACPHLLLSAPCLNLPLTMGILTGRNPGELEILSLTCLPFHHRRSEVIISVQRERKNKEKRLSF